MQLIDAVLLKTSTYFTSNSANVNNDSVFEMRDSSPDHNRYSCLSKKECMALARVIESFAVISTTKEFLSCCDGALQLLFPHEMLACGIRNINGGQIESYRVLLNNYPKPIIDLLMQADGTMKDSPLMARWRETQQPQLFEMGRDEEMMDPTWLAMAKKFNIKNMAAHGVKDFQGCITSYYAFARIPGVLNLHHAYILRLLVPHLDMALARAAANERDQSRPKVADGSDLLSGRQKEILRWIHAGKTNNEISQILGFSEANVKYHIKEILAKLHVVNRTQAVARAITLELLII